MYCLDSCVCIDFLRGRKPQVYELFEKTNPQLIIVPSVVAAELMLGAEKSSKPDAVRAKVEEFLLPFQVVPFDWKCVYHYARLRAALEKRGNVIGGNDMLIAATALANEATLVTDNIREFKRIRELSLETWHVMEL